MGAASFESRRTCRVDGQQRQEAHGLHQCLASWCITDDVHWLDCRLLTPTLCRGPAATLTNAIAVQGGLKWQLRLWS